MSKADANGSSPKSHPRAGIRSTCLFTGVDLSETTKQEHVIAASLGGRSSSSHVSSNEFNECAGETVDTALAGAYRPIFNRIGILTAGGAPRMATTVEGDDGRFEFGEGGTLSRKSLKILKDATGKKILSASAGSREALQKLIRSTGQDPILWKLTEEPATESGQATFDVAYLSKEIEIAALKSILLTCDHCLRDDQNRFTRRPELAFVRDFVREAVFSKPDLKRYDSIVLGIQYHKLRELSELRKLVSSPETPFEHVMVVCGNPASRALDAVWLVAGVDPFGFRLSTCWTAEPFTAVIVSGVLRGSPPLQIHQVPREFSCSPRPNSRALQKRDTSDTAIETMLKEVGAHHQLAVQRAISLVERSAPDFVWRHILQEARVGLSSGNGGLIKDALDRRLQWMFTSRIAQSRCLAQFDAVLQRHFSAADPALCAEAVTEKRADGSREKWIRLEIAILDELEPIFGFPGDFGEQHIIIDRSKLAPRG